MSNLFNTIDDDGSNPGAPPVVYDEETIVWGAPDDEKISITDGESGNGVVKFVSWWAYSAAGETLRFRSLDKATIMYLNSNPHAISNTAHVSLVPVGNVQGSVDAVLTNVTYTGSSTTLMKVNLSFQDKRTYIARTGETRTRYSPIIHSSQQWTLTELGRVPVE